MHVRWKQCCLGGMPADRVGMTTSEYLLPHSGVNSCGCETVLCSDQQGANDVQCGGFVGMAQGSAAVVVLHSLICGLNAVFTVQAYTAMYVAPAAFVSSEGGGVRRVNRWHVTLAGQQQVLHEGT